MIYELIGLIVCIIVIFCVVYIKIWELKQIDIAEKQIENMERIDSIIAQQDYQLLSLAGGLSQFEVNKIYPTLKKSGAWHFCTIKVNNRRIYFKKYDGMKGYFDIKRGKVDTVSLNHIVVMRNGELLMGPCEDKDKYNI